MTDPFACIDATWPAAAYPVAGGFTVRQGLGGGSRVSCASLNGSYGESSIDAAIALHRALGQDAKFMLRPGEDDLDRDLAARGFEVFDPVTIYAGELRHLPTDDPQACWPLPADLAAAWEQDGIGPARRAVMERTMGPKAVLSCREQGAPAALAFVATHEDTVMLHALFTVPAHRRNGLARKILAQAVGWGNTVGATTLALVVTRANTAANALYSGFGMHPVSHYHYRREAP